MRVAEGLILLELYINCGKQIQNFYFLIQYLFLEIVLFIIIISFQMLVSILEKLESFHFLLISLTLSMYLIGQKILNLKLLNKLILIF